MKNLLLLLMIIVTMLSSCSTKQLEEKDARIAELEQQLKELEQNNPLFISEDLQSLIEDSNGFTKNSGDFIDVQQAHDHLESFKDHVGRDPSNSRRPKPGVLYAFSFGLEKMKTLMKGIEDINQMKADSIIGVRVYFSRKYRPLMKKDGPDVFMIPIAWNQKNIYQVDDGFDDKPNFVEPLILNNSVPCPNQCE